MGKEIWGHCVSCDRWFYVTDPTLEAFYRCPVCMLTADRLERRIVLDHDREHRRGGSDGAA